MHDGDLRAQLRDEARAKRRDLALADRQIATEQLASHVASLSSCLAGKVVGVFIADDGEPDLSSTIELLRRLDSRPALPVLDKDRASRTMGFMEWIDGDDLFQGTFGIMRPPPGDLLVPDVVFVPLVAFDRSLSRLGRGSGFYDRWLGARNSSSPPLTIGAAFEVQRCDVVPLQSHDVPLDVLVTDLGVRWR